MDKEIKTMLIKNLITIIENSNQLIINQIDKIQKDLDSIKEILNNHINK